MKKIIKVLFVAFSVIFPSLLMASNTSVAAHALADFNKLSSEIELNSGSVIVEKNQFVFFVTEQMCLVKKKFSGTKESKVAYEKIIENAASYFTDKKITNNKIKSAYKGRLAEDITYSVARLKNAAIGKMMADAYRIIDRDIGGCTRRVVVAFSKEKIKPEIVNEKLSIDEESALIYVFSKANESNDYQRLRDYFSALDLTQLAISFSAQDSQTKQNFYYPIIFNWLNDAFKISTDLERCKRIQDDVASYRYPMLIRFTAPSFCNSVYPREEDLQNYLSENISLGMFDSVLSESDQFSVVNSVLDNSGFVLFHHRVGVSEDIEKLNADAFDMYSKGVDPKRITSLMIRSLNIQPNQPHVWRKLGSIFLAYKLNGAAQAGFSQALLLEPENIDNWINLSRVIKRFGDTDRADRIISIARKLKNTFTISDWGMQQIKK
ncbi:tetratricopeptide repeat protein [Pelagibaculum spongiae]|uniref:Uncharacterized protein n=1 Tax=Pelagibaculum spongiae TaxID=2080658 RepID=A0A2V1H0C8_9GAMM|nr:hypothetical protein [Pelagibaculum spongiae]PVZ70654.1 hypothetical protein DC094_08750 [Pelagibaculum spongiae]